MTHCRVGLLLLLFPIFISPSYGGPFECRFEDVVGVWNFYISDVSTNTMGCVKNDDSNNTKYTVELSYPDIAKDEFGNPGYWTLVDGAGKFCFHFA